MATWRIGNGRNAMNGAKFLLDTNYILGLVKGQPEVFADIQNRGGGLGLVMSQLPGKALAEDRSINSNPENIPKQGN